MRAVCGVSVMVLGLAACSDFTSSGDPLTDTEASELAGALAEQGFVGFEGFASPSQSPAANDEAAVVINYTFDDTAPCDGGGTVRLTGKLSGDFDDAAGTGTIEFDYTLVPTSCQVTTESDLVFTLSGDPNLKASGELNFGQESWSGSLKYEGKFAWTEGTRSGACGVNLQANYEFTFGGTTVNGSASVTGEVCGVSVNRTITIQDV